VNYFAVGHFSECFSFGRKSPQQGRSHKPWREAMGARNAGLALGFLLRKPLRIGLPLRGQISAPEGARVITALDQSPQQADVSYAVSLPNTRQSD
jgi:hypothetical protein